MAKLFGSTQEAAAHDYQTMLTDKARHEKQAENRRRKAYSDAIEAGAKTEDVTQFSGLISQKDREALRAIVRKEHLAHYPDEFLTNAEIDKFIDSWAESYVEKQIRRGYTS